MAFDKPTRNRLASFVSEARNLIANEFTQQFQSIYGIAEKGEVTALEHLGHLDDAGLSTATLLRERIEYLVRTHPGEKGGAKAAVDRLAREQAFTVLNRLAALRMAEKRDLIVESVGKGYQSKGFKVFEQVAGSGLGDTYSRYRRYLYCLFDELAVDLGLLFDRSSPQGLLFPREPALLELLKLLNAPDLDALWTEDETIGWIYQYYNDPAERKKMRDESAAPRNSRELAVRNQFFTPRYVVEFLTDNTLGRIWYEMARGKTRLVEQCRYLVRRPKEIFLGDPEQAYDAIFGQPEERYSPNPPVAAAFQGNLAEIPEDDSWESRWISVAIPPDQFEKITGEPDRDLYDDDRLSRVIEAACTDEESPLLKDISLFWAALSKFTLGDYSRGYSAETWRKCWQRFIKEVRSKPAEVQSQGELLKQPVFIPHRPIKDPREIRMLDPACGSMHFGLYAFDLFEVIYDEAWEIAHGNDTATKASTSFAPFVSFVEIYPDKAAFLADVPRLIIEHNIHGIDIDPRCTQIAGLSLWLRAQKSWQLQKVSVTRRPRIRKSNIVCAEPMPGDKAMLREFVQNQFSASEQPAFSHLLETTFDKMELAGEAGSLLKIEEEIRSAVDEAHKLWQKTQTKAELFSTEEINRTLRPGTQQKLGGLEQAVSQVSKDFWETAEKRIYDSLRDYAEQAENGGGFQRRLFAEDAAQGFAFIDICRKRYEVVLMNPPFGQFSPLSFEYTSTSYPLSKQDCYAAFVERALQILGQLGTVGAITNRTGLFLATLTPWRTQVVLGTSRLFVLADLGFGVLDDAVVEAAAYVLRRPLANSIPTNCFRLLRDSDKERALKDRVALVTASNSEIAEYFAVFQESLKAIPLMRCAYWISQRLREAFATFPSLVPNYAQSRVGMHTSDNFRFLRLEWEVPTETIGGAARDFTVESSVRWARFAKGGEYSSCYGDIHLLVDWADNGRVLKAWASSAYGESHWSRLIQGADFYFRDGLTYPRRTASGFSPRVLPEGCLFDAQAPCIFPKDRQSTLAIMGLLTSRPATVLIDAQVAAADAATSGSAARTYEVGVVGAIPVPSMDRKDAEEVGRRVKRIWEIKQSWDARDETSRFFSGTGLRFLLAEGLHHGAERLTRDREEGVLEIIELGGQIEGESLRLYRLDGAAVKEIETECGRYPDELPRSSEIDAAALSALYTSGIDDVIDKQVAEGGGSRSVTKKTYVADRLIELLAVKFGVHPSSIIKKRRDLGLARRQELIDLARYLVSFLTGCVFGRWDLCQARVALDGASSPDPFTPLPVCPPGMFQNAQGLPVEKDEVRRLKDEGKWNYPIEISWDGILVDDPNHPLDIVGRVREVIEIIWKDRAEAIEHEACEILGVKSLRDYFRKPTGFYADHLKRYSKSRRQAPIYWPLSTVSGSYTLWIYYHRLNENTLHTALADFIDPKLKSLRDEISYLRNNGNRQARLEELRDLEQELQEFRVEIERIIKLPSKPNLNDGVLITASPLWKVFRLPKWQKDLKACWEELSDGEYDWAHLAYTIWPDRVKEVCKADRSIAIAHGLEHLCKVEAPKLKSKRKKVSNASFDDLEA